MPRRNPRIEEAPLQGELMLFDPESSRFFVLNRTMSFIWRRCDGVAPVSEVLAGLIESFEGTDAAAAQQDLARGLEELSALGLLEAGVDR